MKIAKWLKKFNASPCDLTELAERLDDVTDAPDLTKAAFDYRKAEEAFRKALAKLGYEPG
jgi:hypothetical protein